MYVWPAVDLTADEINSLVHRVRPTTSGAGLEEVQFVGQRCAPRRGELAELAVRISLDASRASSCTSGRRRPSRSQPLDDYRQKVLRAARRGTVYPYELTSLLAGPDGTFTEYDLDDTGALVPVDRPKGKNTAALVAGVVTTPTPRHPEGVTRVVLLGDPTKSLGALSEPECARVIAALDLAERIGVPLEWFALSSGARISMTSGTENMDWVAAALKRIVEFTQAGGEINIVVAGINVGAQPYWNAEATMLMHTKGILVMTPDSAMVLTGKQSLDFSGGVSAEDNFGIGGYDRVMGPNGQAQYWAPNLTAACDVLMAHYDHTYVAPGETRAAQGGHHRPGRPRRLRLPARHGGQRLQPPSGEIFSAEHNPDRKKPFDIRTVMRALSDQDHPVLERWAGMADADTSVVQDVHLGGRPVCLIGIESRAVPRRGFPPTDGPDTYTAGTLFPQSSKKTARAINAASGNRPLVVLANLSGFDGSPESMRKLQLEYGAEIGRAIVNFDGPIVFCVISRYHGGAFVVFSKALNPNMTVLALEGSFASVLGGAPGGGRGVLRRGQQPHRDRPAGDRAAGPGWPRRAGPSGPRSTLRLAEVQASVRAEKLGEVAAEFDRVHSIQRAVEVGSVDAIISVAQLRPAIIEAIERGLAAGPAVRISNVAFHRMPVTRPVRHRRDLSPVARATAVLVPADGKPSGADQQIRDADHDVPDLPARRRPADLSHAHQQNAIPSAYQYQTSWPVIAPPLPACCPATRMGPRCPAVAVRQTSVGREHCANAGELLDEGAGVDREGDAGDVAGLVGGEEQHGVADVDGLDPGDGQRVDRLEDRRRRLAARVRVGGVEHAPRLLVLDHDAC